MKHRMSWIRLVMVGSWLAAAGLGCVAVLSDNVCYRCASVALIAFLLAPTAVLALRQVERESVMRSLRDRKQPEPEAPEQTQSPETEQTGVFVDPLTGLASRRYFNMFLQRELSRSHRANKPMALAVFDVDEFSRLESKLGQDVVATSLADMGARMKSALREYDLAARYADGRLVVILPETDMQAAAEVVKRLHGLAASVCADGQQISVTVGLANFPEHGSTPDELINSAHRALNRGKAECSNQVHMKEDVKKAA